MMRLLGAISAGLVLLAGFAGGSAQANEILDGNHLEVEGQAMRLHGIDAFELGQTCLDARGVPWRCGVVAKAALAERVQGTTLSCTVLDEEPDGVYIARCATQDGTDLGGYLVENGLALAAPSVADYAALETAARAADAGAWEGTFMPPWQWRAQ
jgi:endonuclease YncB( thermonuclease family)